MMCCTGVIWSGQRMQNNIKAVGGEDENKNVRPMER